MSFDTASRSTTDPGNPHHDGLKLADTVGERRGSRLQDDRRLDLVDVTVSHCVDRVPSRALLDALSLHRLTAPRGDDHVRVAPDDIVRRDDALLCRDRRCRAPETPGRRLRPRPVPPPSEFPRSAAGPIPRRTRAAGGEVAWLTRGPQRDSRSSDAARASAPAAQPTRPPSMRIISRMPAIVR